MISSGKALAFDDVLMVPKYTDKPSRRNVDISVDLGKYKFAVPVISAAMDTITGAKMAVAMSKLGGLGMIHRFMSVEENVAEFLKAKNEGADIVGVSVGVNEGITRAEALYDAGARIFSIDVAHAHSKLCGDMIKLLRDKFGSDILIIAGSVATREGTKYVADCGADVARVGIGGGGVCTTRMKTGFGVPLLHSVMECSNMGIPIIADGGIRGPNDINKALAAGATMVMIGGMLAGTDETPGEVFGAHLIQPDGSKIFLEKKKAYRGMASREAFEDYFGAMPDWKTAEGVYRDVDCKGPVKTVIDDIVGGLNSALTYGGASTIKELQNCVTFIEITQAGYLESTPHFK